MSLLDCICCSRHSHHVAAYWDPCSGACLSTVTYSELQDNSRQLAAILRDHSVSYNVGLYGECCPKVITALIAVMAIPGAYVPLSIHQPLLRQLDHLRSNRIDAILVQESVLNIFLSDGLSLGLHCMLSLSCQTLIYGFVLARLHWTTGLHPQPLTVDHSLLTNYKEEVIVSCWPCQREEFASDPWPLPKISPSSLAYILSTSGTTGQPVTVKVPHCCIVPNILDLRERFNCGHYDVIFNAAPLTFDPSIVEIMVGLSSGASLLTVPGWVKGVARKLSKALRPVTILQATPTLISRFGGDELQRGLLGPDSKLRVLAFGGESCPDFNTLSKWKHRKNSTLLFNLYGVTEMSSWATCYQLPDTAGPVLLGNPLLGSKVEVRNADGSAVECGYGIIWTDGDYRVCVVGAESVLCGGRVRCTGDVGRVLSGGGVVYVGRQDRRIKRWGHRISLDRTEQVIEALDCVTSCVVTTTSYPWPPPHDRENFPNEQGDFPDSSLAHSDRLLAFIVPVDTGEISAVTLNEFRGRVFAELKSMLPPSAVPDEIVLINQVPLTHHGKADIKSLLNYSKPEVYMVVSQPEGRSTTKRTLNSKLITELLCESAQNTIDIHSWSKDATLTELGATSFDIVRLSTHFLEAISHHSSSDRVQEAARTLVESLLTNTLEQVAVQMLSALGNDGRGICRDNRKRSQSISDEGPAETHIKQARVESLLWDKSDIDIWSWRAGKMFRNGHLLPNSIIHPNNLSPNKLSLQFSVRWHVDTGKCVDSSPLLCCGLGGGPVVFVGSHSGLFLCLEECSGTVKWRQQLPDRIESSPCLSLCGHFVAVGRGGDPCSVILETNRPGNEASITSAL